jgi:hypothetical protein
MSAPYPIDPATGWPAWPDPPAIGTERVLARRRDRYGQVIGRSGAPTAANQLLRREAVLPAGTRVRIVSHTLGSGHYGPGCYVTPVDPQHRYTGWRFFIRHEALRYLREPAP